MKRKKLRGHKRIWSAIAKWKNTYLQLDIENLQANQRDYVKVWVHPYSGISLLNSETPPPRGTTRKLILEALLSIFENWKAQLTNLNQPYYLKLWLYEPDISKSQIVCGIGHLLDFYTTTFHKPSHQKKFSAHIYGSLQSRLEKLHWEHALEEVFINPDDLGSESDYETKLDFLEEKQWYSKQIKKAHRKIENNTDPNAIIKHYAIKKGTVWLGQ